jgi:hypothetical protein
MPPFGMKISNNPEIVTLASYLPIDSCPPLEMPSGVPLRT